MLLELLEKMKNNSGPFYPQVSPIHHIGNYYTWFLCPHKLYVSFANLAKMGKIDLDPRNQLKMASSYFMCSEALYMFIIFHIRHTNNGSFCVNRC